MIFNMVGGGGGSGATLVVSSPANVSVTVSKGDKSYTKNSGSLGSSTFKGLATGTWTVTISGNGQTATKTIGITADYAITIAFFSASIIITYPATSTCVVTNSDGQTVASDTNTGSSTKTWTATVNTTGTYTVTATATDGSGKSKSTTVNITTDGQSKSVTLSYLIYYYNQGDQCTAVTGGWDFSGDGALTKLTDHMQYKSSYLEAYLSTANKVDLTQISYITFDVEWVGSLPPSSRHFLGITTNKFSNSASAAIRLNTTSRNQYSLDVKSISGEYYIAGAISLEDGGSGYMNIYNIWGMPV